LSRSDLIRNSFSASPKSHAVPQKSELRVAIAVGLRAQSRLPGTEFLDAETKRQKSPRKCANACRDQNPRREGPEIPAETPYLASYRKREVCKDWMVEVVGHKLATHHSNRSLKSESGTEFFDAETDGPDPPFSLAETDAETRTNSKKPAIRGTNARITRGVRYLKTGWWRHSGTNWRPTTQSSNQSPPPSRERKFAMQRRARKSRLIT
jgi:hypothetical protein